MTVDSFRQCEIRLSILSGLSGRLTAVVACLLVSGLIASQEASAQDIQLTRSSLTNGGVVGKTGGSFEMSGAIGTLNVSDATGGPFRISGSMWTTTRTPMCIADIPGYGSCFPEDGGNIIKHWAGDAELPRGREWGTCLNWYENAIPVDGEYVCIPASDCQDRVIYREPNTVLPSMECSQDFVISGSGGPTRLELDQDSNILGDAELVGNATLWLNSQLQVVGGLNWRHGTIDGQGSMQVHDGLLLTQDSVTLNRGDFKLLGGHGLSNGPFVTMASGATFEVGPLATYEYQGSSTVISGDALLDVRGTLARSSGDGVAGMRAPIDNSGLIHNKTGELWFYKNSSHTGQLVSDPGTTLGFTKTHMFSPESSLVAENVTLWSGNGSEVHGTVNISERIDGKGANWEFAADDNVISYGKHFYVERGRVNFYGPTDHAVDFETITITTPGQSSGTVEFGTGQPINVGIFSMITGSLRGNSPIVVSDEFSWTNGFIYGGGAITVDGNVRFNATSSTRTLSRVVNINNTATFASGFSMSGGGRINVADGAVVNVTGANVAINGRVFANNGGTVLRPSGAGTFAIGSAIVQDGLFHNQAGTISFATHPLNGPSTYTGDILCDPGTVLEFAGAGHTLQPASTMTSDSLVLKASNSTCHGSVNLSDSIDCEGCSWTFAPDANIVSYGDTIRITRGSLRLESPTDREISFDTVTLDNDFNSGTLYLDTGQPVHVGQLLMLNAGSVLNGSSPITINDLFTWGNGSIFAGGAITNLGTATINPTSSQRNLSRRFDNFGDMIFKGSIELTGSTPINNMPGGVIDLRGGGLGLGGVVNNDGTIIKSAGTGTSVMADTFNAGTVDIQTESITFNTSFNHYHQTAGETILNDTALVFTGSTPIFHLEGGALRGNGVVDGNIDNTGGTVMPGFSAGQITVTGNYNQAADAALEIEIAGTAPEEYDALSVTGTANLAGELRVTEIDGFVPNIGDSFVILTASAVSGTFDSESVPPHYAVHYDETEVRLEIVLPSADLNRDGAVDLLDFSLFQTCFHGSSLPPSVACGDGINADLDIDGDVDLDDFILFYAAISQ